MLTCILATTLAGGAFTETWNTVPDRQWIGENWWANRLQDWEIEDGAVWCIEDRPWLAMRTAHLLTHRIDASQGEVLMEVDLLPPPAGWPKGAAVGVLLGCGSSDIDHRLTAQTHHVPAEDGGFLVLVDSAGAVTARSFESTLDIGGQWSISKKVSLDNLPMLDGEQSGHVQVAELPIRLRVQVKGDGLSAVVRSGDQWSEWVSEDAISPSLLSGGVALVSHEGKFGFDNMSLTGRGVTHHADRAWGPVLCTLYTVDDGVLSMTAQFPPMDALRPGEAILEIEREGDWHPTSMALIDSDSWTATFRVPRWDATSSSRYRIRFEESLADYTTRATYSQIGTIPEEPTQGEFVVAAMNCQKIYTGNLKWNHNGLWMPHDETVRSVAAHQPDLIFFAGDQIYEGDLTPVDAKKLTLDYLYKWFRWCWSFGELTRNCPTVVIPDDHDVYHGNIWGAGGRRAVKTKTLSAQDSGGYRWPAEFVNTVHRTQTSHLPAPADPTPIEQGISVYYTDLDWGGLSCAILADRMFKSSPSVAVPDGQFKNGWPQDPDFDAAADADVPGAELLGERQEKFLEKWASRSDDRFASVVFSQTPFCNLATLPPKATSGSALPQARLLEADAYPDGYTLASDGDSNGWPQTPRNRAVRSMAKASATHICGDQHLGALLEYGVDSFDDGVWAFSVPAVSNTWPRRWFPPEPGDNRVDGSPRYTGEFFDGFGNRMRVHAVANPQKSGRKPSNLHDRMPGYGIVRFDRTTGRVTFECWRRPQRGASEVPSQYPGWPRHN